MQYVVGRPQGGSTGNDYNQQYYEQYWNNYAAWQGYGGSAGGGGSGGGSGPPQEAHYYDPYAASTAYAEYDQSTQDASQEEKPTKEDFEPVGELCCSSQCVL